MKLIVGLGNPGTRYAGTRHNLGRMALDAWVSCLSAEQAGGTCDSVTGTSSFVPAARFEASLTAGTHAKPARGRGTEKVIMALPTTYMNESGRAVARLARFYKVPSSDIWVLHDDLDIPLGSLLVQRDRGAAGHNGVASVIEELGTKDFVRFRLGIKPARKSRLPADAFVLRRFTRTEQPRVEQAIDRAGKALGLAMDHGVQAAMNEFNARS